MALQNFEFKYGKGKVKFQIEQDRIMKEIKMADAPVISDPEEAVRQAIRNPIGSKPLREIVKPGQTVVFIVNDPTRIAQSHVFMPVLLAEVNEAGIKDEDVSIIFALGAHRLMTDEEMTESVGEAVAKRVKMYNSDCQDQSQFKYFGETSRGTPIWFHKIIAEADHVICTGSIVQHFFSGYGGGRKAIFPGVSYYETIRKNHSLMLDSNAVIGRLHGNPVYEDQMEGVAMCPPSFLINVVLNEKKEFLKVFAGHYDTAHIEATKFVADVYGTNIPQEADLVIATCGGYPKDINVYQLQKTMDNTWCAVREGGIVIILGECIEGSGSAAYEKTMQEYNTPDKVEALLRSNFQIGAHKAYAVTRLMKKAEFILVSTLPPELSKTLLFTPASTIEEALSIAYEKLGKDPSVILMPQGSLTVPRVEK
ncbi:MAG: nickel-dependent lactate racemase [Sporomusaceae bacterium]|jgi:nickel-dependent lactate racemase|nr:nickel-dependent lactate racemase [Sporomusaceae bacterium]